jgi:broad specificity phosphatase PhoE
VVFCSPLLRARETASYIPSDHGIVILENLREFDFGQWEMNNYRDLLSSSPHLQTLKQRNWEGLDAPGGERWTDFETRLGELHPTLLNTSGAVVVAHLLVNAMLAKSLAGLEFSAFRQGYCESVLLSSRADLPL